MTSNERYVQCVVVACQLGIEGMFLRHHLLFERKHVDVF